MSKSDDNEKNQYDNSGEMQESEDATEQPLNESDIDSSQNLSSEDPEPMKFADTEHSPDEELEDKKEDNHEDDSIPDWLRPEFTAEEDDKDTEANEVDSVMKSEVAGGDQPATQNDDYEKETEPTETGEVMSTDNLDELGWLEQIASGEGSSLEESPTMSWDDQTEASDVAEMSEDEAWLDELDTEKSLPVVENLESGDLSPGEAIEQPRNDQVADGLPSENDPAGELPEDPDEVMAWLENLAARQGADPEELPTYSAASPDLGQAQIDEIPEDPDEAMAWLEQLAADEESPTEETLLVELEESEQSDELIAQTPISELIHDESAEPSEFQVSEDLDEALIWLEEIVDMPVKEDDDTSPVQGFEDSRADLAEPVAEEDAALDDEFEDEDVEQAMEWLEQLAARQGAAPEELTSDLSAEEEVQVPEWVEAQGEEFKPEELVELALSSELELVDDDVELATSENGGMIEAGEPFGVEVEEFSSIDEGVIESLSEMAPEVAAEPASDEDMDWLETLGNVDAEGWLDSEEDATEVPLDSQISQIEAGILISKEFAADSETQDIDELEVDELQASDSLDEGLFRAAHSAVDAGNYLQAVEEYSILMEKEIDLIQLIRELESSNEAFTREPVMQRLLGDAYAKNGQTQKALKVYRRALDSL